MDRSTLINCFTALRPGTRYLEIGIHLGKTFFAVEAAEKTGVDPNIRFDHRARSNPQERFFEITSDSYFETHADRGRPFDVCFIDGQHTFEQAFRDFTNVLFCSAPHAVIVIDDVNPAHWLAALPLGSWQKVRPMFPELTGWSGDVFKMTAMIETFFPMVTFRFPAEAPEQLVCWTAPKARAQDEGATRGFLQLAQSGYAEFLVQNRRHARAAVREIVADYLATHAT
jgi:hypothetical protein